MVVGVAGNMCGGGHLLFLHLDCDTLAIFSHGTKRRHVRVYQFMDFKT